MRFQYRLDTKRILDEIRKFTDLKLQVEKLYQRKVILSEGFEKFVCEFSQKDEHQVNPSQLIKLYEKYRNYLYRRVLFLTLLLELYPYVEKIEVPADNIFNEPVIPVSRRGLQSSNYMLPNVIVRLKGGSREYTIFFEVPSKIVPLRPGESLETLPREVMYIVNALSEFLIVDIGIIASKVLNFLDPSRTPPFKTVDIVVLCRSIPEWWTRMYSVRDPGLIEKYVLELAAELNMKVNEILIRSRDPRLKVEVYYTKDLFLIPLIKKIYCSKLLVLVSKVKISDKVYDLLSKYCDKVFESTMFNVECLKSVSRNIVQIMMHQPQ